MDADVWKVCFHLRPFRLCKSHTQVADCWGVCFSVHRRSGVLKNNFPSFPVLKKPLNQFLNLGSVEICGGTVLGARGGRLSSIPRPYPTKCQEHPPLPVVATQNVDNSKGSLGSKIRPQLRTTILN